MPSALSQSENSVDVSSRAVVQVLDPAGPEFVVETPAQPLPIGWTQVKRRPNLKKASRSGAVEMEWCCDDPSCKSSSSSHRKDPNARPLHVEVHEGQGIVCLHEFGSSWFQGYFLPTHNKKPWGLLAVEEELDECLECADGGYRRVTITAFPWMNGKKKKVRWEKVEWTGGDMMKLDGGSDISMETHRMLTGVAATPYVEKYFGGVLDAARKSDTGLDEHRSVLEVLPDVAVVIGPMKIGLNPNELQEGVEEKR